MERNSSPGHTANDSSEYQSLDKKTYNHEKVCEEINNIPYFLDAIGLKTSQVGLTLYGGSGGNWHWKKIDGSSNCMPVDISLILEKIPDWSVNGFLRQGHQLGFYPMWGGSTKEQSQGSPCLKVECDTLPKEQQLIALRAFEHSYNVTFTIIDTGGKSLHAYLSLDEVIPVEKYQLVCRCFHQKLAEVAYMEDLVYEADDAVSRINQTMRLPGAIHKKTQHVATVLQLGKQCSLEQIECGTSDVDDFRKESTTSRAYTRICNGGRVLGYQKNEARKILTSIVQIWDKRIPGGNTYEKILPLITNLTAVLGAEQAAQLLYEQGHNDKRGNHNLQGLLEWCSSFTKPVDPAKATARLISIAVNTYKWERPVASTSIISDPATESINTEEQLRDAIKGRSVLTNCRTGKGKSKQILSEATAMHLESRQRNGEHSMFSVGCISPRQMINAQNAQRTGGRDVSTGSGWREDFYLACLKSWGQDHKCHGNKLLWCNGVMPAAGVLIIDELRQVMEGLLLGKAGPEEFWKSAQERVEAFRGLVWSIRNAARIYGMDAQLGTPEIEFINHVRGLQGSLPVVGNPHENNGGVFRWSNKQNKWRAALLATIQDPDRRKPVLVVTGAKGEEQDSSTRGVSAWSLKRFIESETAEEITSTKQNHTVDCTRVRVIVVDKNTKGKSEQQKILMNKEMDIADVVIFTPVAQSGFSFIDNFHKVGFVAGGMTMPPNCVAQGARRERNLEICYGYLPRTEFNQNCPFFTSCREENGQVIKKAMLEHGRDIDKLDLDDKLMINTTLAYYERYITELELFTDYALAYLHQDGWKLEFMDNAIKPENKKKSSKKRTKATHRTTPLEELSHSKQLVIKGLTGVLSNEEVTKAERNAVAGGLVDLVGANASKVIELLKRSGLDKVCDGITRPKDDPQIIACAEVLQSQQALELFKRSNALQVRASRSRDKSNNAIKAIGVIVKQLGGVWDSRCGKGRSKVRGELPSAG